MPKIATYGEQRVSPQVTPGNQRGALPADSLGVADRGGEAVGQGLMNLGSGLYNFSQNLSQFSTRVATTKAEETLSQFERDKNRLLFDPDNGYMNSQGRDAYERAEDTEKELERMRRAYAEQLDSPEARQMFSTASEGLLVRSQQDILRHSSNQLNAWETATMNARMEDAIENAALYWSDPERMAVQRELMRQSVFDVAEKQGLDGDALKEMVDNAESAFALTAIRSATQTDPAEGQRIFDEIGSRLEGPDFMKAKDEIATATRVMTDRQTSNQAVVIAAQLVDQYGPDNRAEALEQINSITDPQLQQKARSELNTQMNAVRTARVEQQGATFEAAQRAMREQGVTVQQYIAANPEGWDMMTEDQRRTLESGLPATTNWQMFSEFALMDQDDLAQVNPAEHFHALADAERQKLINMVEGARTGRNDQTARTRTAQTTAVVRQLFDDDNDTATESFWSLVDSETRFREEQKGSTLSSAEYTEMLNELSMQVTIERPFWFSTDRDITDIPSEYVPQLTDFLRENNIPVNGRNLLDAYKQATD